MFKRKEWMSQETGEIVVGWWGKLFASWENRVYYGIKDSKWKLYKRG